MASVTVDGVVLVADAPVTYLLFLEKQLTDMHTFVSKLPVLDPSEAWLPAKDPVTDCWQTEAAETTKTKKVPRNHVKAEATDKHPAQVEVYYEDVPVGIWTRVQFSGAVASKDRDKLLRRVNSVLDAIQVAVEEANAVEVAQKKIGEALFAFLLA